jgi:hypothetical protein
MEPLLPPILDLKQASSSVTETPTCCSLQQRRLDAGVLFSALTDRWQRRDEQAEKLRRRVVT